MRSIIVGLAALALVGCREDPVPPCAGAGTICAIAGNGEAGFNGDGRPGHETSFYFVSRVRPDRDGTIHVMDSNTMRLRVLRADATVGTVVGSGAHNWAEPGSDALESPLENPFDFDFDDEGRLVFIMLHDPRVMRVEHDGTLAVLAGSGELGDAGDGGPAELASFTQLNGMALAPDGTIYVADAESNRVRVIQPDGMVAAYAGTGVKGLSGDGGPAIEAELFHPEGIALDDDGDLYIADTFNHVVRRVDAATGQIETIAGTGEQGLSGDGGPAIEAQLRLPMGVAVGHDGAIYIADSLNHRICRVSDGIIETIAGTVEGRAGDGGPAIEAQLRGPVALTATETALYVADMQNHSARVIYLAP